MALRPLVLLPDPRLRLISSPVVAFDAALKQLAEDMFETMYDAPGVGLAAVQIGEIHRVVTIDVSGKEEKPEPIAFINPELIWSSTEMSVYEEGCLSIPDYYEEVERPASVRVRFQDVHGKTQELLAEGLLSTCIQHEIDHLNGKLFIDHISRLKRERVIKKFTKMAARRDTDSSFADESD